MQEKMPEFKIKGEQYLRDMFYTFSEHNPEETVDFGTLGIILENYNKIHNLKN